MNDITLDGVRRPLAGIVHQTDKGRPRHPDSPAQSVT